MDKIRINGIKAYGHHGALPEEKRLGQLFRISLELGLDTRAAAATDNLALTVDYAAVIGTVVATVRDKPPANLIETMAAQIAAEILQNFPNVQQVAVELEKPYVPVAADFAGVAVLITRHRENLTTPDAT
jgi:dihydroneopterin aldolase